MLINSKQTNVEEFLSFTDTTIPNLPHDSAGISPDNSPSKTMVASSSTDASYYSTVSHIETREVHQESSVSAIASKSDERFSNSQTVSNNSTLHNVSNISRSDVNQFRGTVIEIAPNSPESESNIPSEPRRSVVSQKSADTSFSSQATSTGYSESIVSSMEPSAVLEQSDNTDSSVNISSSIKEQPITSDTNKDSNKQKVEISNSSGGNTQREVEESVSSL